MDACIIIPQRLPVWQIQNDWSANLMIHSYKLFPYGIICTCLIWKITCIFYYEEYDVCKSVLFYFIENLGNNAMFFIEYYIAYKTIKGTYSIVNLTFAEVICKYQMTIEVWVSRISLFPILWYDLLELALPRDWQTES